MFKIRYMIIFLSGMIALLANMEAVEAQEDRTDESNPQQSTMSETAAPFVKPDSWVSIGVGVLDGGRREQFGIFDNERDGGARLLLDADIKFRNDTTGTWATARIKDLGQDNRNVGLCYDRQGLWGVNLNYQEMPKIEPYSVLTSNQVGTSSQTINTIAAPGTGSEIKIGTERDRTKFTVYKTFKEQLRLNLSFMNEEKTGTRHWGGRAYGANNATTYPEFYLEPINWTTQELDTNLNYMGKDLQLTFGYIGSWFNNGDNLVSTMRDNGTAQTYMSLPMDNEAHKLHLSGGYSFTDATRGTFQLSYGQALQNEHLPTADIVGFAAGTAPGSLEGRVDSTLAQLDLTSRVTPAFTLLSQLRYFKEDDRTPSWSVVTGATTIHAHPISKATYSGKLEAAYRFPDKTHLTTGIEHEIQDREIPFGNDSDGDVLDNERVVPFRADLDETTYKIQLSRALTDIANASLSLKHSNRIGSTFIDGDRLTDTPEMQINPYYIADRDRDKIRLAVDVRPIDALGLQFSSEFTNDQHDRSQRLHGRDKARIQLYSIDADYAYNSDLLFTAWYSHQSDKVWLNSYYAYNGANQPEKYSEVTDVSNSFGLGIRNRVNSSVKVGADLLQTFTEVEYQDKIEPVPASQLPNIDSNSTKVSAFVEYLGLGPGILRADFIHETWDSNDWSWKFSDDAPYVYQNDGTTVISRGGQAANFVGLRYTTKF